MFSQSLIFFKRCLVELTNLLLKTILALSSPRFFSSRTNRNLGRHQRMKGALSTEACVDTARFRSIDVYNLLYFQYVCGDFVCLYLESFCFSPRFDQFCPNDSDFGSGQTALVICLLRRGYVRCWA